MNIRGKAWCPNCQKEQPASLVGLSIDGDEKTVTGFCSVCEHPVERKFTVKARKKIEIASVEENNCIPLHASKEAPQPSAESLPPVQKAAEIERPSLLTLVALFSVCLVITYLL